MTPSSRLDQAFDRYLDRQGQADLSTVFDLAAPKLLGRALSEGLEMASAEDVVQETFLVVLERQRKFRRGSPFLPWATGILVRLVRSERRRRARLFRVIDAVESERIPETAEGLQEVELRAEVEKGLVRVSPTNRDVVRAALLEELLPSELAERFSISRNAANVRLHRGLKQLRVGLSAPLGALVAAALAGQERGLAAVRSSVLKLKVASKSPLGSLGAGLAAAAVVAMGLGAAYLSWRGSRPAQVSDTQLATQPLGAAAAPAPAPAEVAATAESEARRPLAAEEPELEQRWIVGRVLDAAGRAAAEGVEIYALAAAPALQLPTAPLDAVARTESGGEFRIPADRLPKGSFVLMARDLVPGGAGLVGWVDGQPGAEAELPDLVLGPEIAVRARVVDTAGRPLEGAELVAFSTYARFFKVPSDEERARGFLAVRPYEHLFHGRTDAEGECVVRGLFGAGSPGVRVMCAVAKPGYVRSVKLLNVGATGIVEPTFELHALGELSLAGSVRDASGAPLAGVTVRSTFRGEAPERESYRSVTGPSGGWDLPEELLDEYPMELRFEKPGFVPRTVSILNPEKLQEGPLAVALDAGRTLRGKVELDGSALAGARIVIGTEGEVRELIADDAGRFEFTDLPRAPAALVVERMEGSLERARYRIGAQEETLRLQLERPAARAATVSVRSTGSSPLERVSLVAESVQGFDGEWPLGLDSAQLASASGVPVGHWTLFVRTEDGQTDVRPVFIESDQPMALRVATGTTAAVQCTVTAAEGVELADARVSALSAFRAKPPSWALRGPEASSLRVAAGVDVTQAFSFAGLVPGRWHVQAEDGAWATERATLEVLPDGAARVDLRAVPAGSVRFELPSVGRPGWCVIETAPLEADSAPGDEDWELRGFQSVTPMGSRPVRVALPAGEWRFRVHMHAYAGSVIDLYPGVTGTVRILTGLQAKVDVRQLETFVDQD